MLGLKYFYKLSLRHDCVNKFCYKNTRQIPKIKKVVLTVKNKTLDPKLTMACSLAIEAVSAQRGSILKTKAANVLSKIKKNQPAGVRVSVKKKLRFFILEQMLLEIFPTIKAFGVRVSNKNSVSFKIPDIFAFSEFDNYFKLFSKAASFDVSVSLISQTPSETAFFFKMLSFPHKERA